MSAIVTEAELQAWVDGCLAPARQRDVDAYLALHPDEAARLAAYRRQNLALRQQFNPVLDEALPVALTLAAAKAAAASAATAANPAAAAAASLPSAPPGAAAHHRWGAPLRMAAMLALTLAGGAGGWLLRGSADGGNGGEPQAMLAAATSAQADGPALARRAALAHAVYTPEVRHPVEVGADQQQHLVAWLSKRLGTPLKPPQLAQLGYVLEGGRLLPGQSGPVAQFMYRDGGGARLTLYVSTEQRHQQHTAFRFAQQGPVAVFYWIDGKFGYALSGNMDKATLGKLADAVYAQLEPAS